MSNSNKWTEENIADQSCKTVIVTGSSSGIGFETARVLANKNVKIIIAVRNLGKGEAAKTRIIEQNKNANISVMQIDLADLSSVKNFADQFRKKFDKLNLLINNAGVMIPPYSKTKDGFELQFGTNHLGHFALTLHLLTVITNTANSRIVNVASNAHKMGNINFDDINWETRKYNPWRAYGDSKIANLYFTNQLAKILDGKNVLVTAAHPGWTATDLQRHSKVFEFANKFFAMPPKQGALPTLRAAVDEYAKSGDYFGPNGWQQWKGYPVLVKPNSLAMDETIANKLWKISEELTNVKF